MREILERTTIGDLLDRQARRFPEADALVHVEHGRRYGYADLREESNRIARGLLALGVVKGDHVAVWATNHPEWVIAQLATAKIGAVLVTVNPSYRTHEVEYVLQQSDASVLVLIERFRTSNYVEMIEGLIPELASSRTGEIRSARFPKLRRIILIGDAARPGMILWGELGSLGKDVSEKDLDQRQKQCDPDDVINIQYTSGTTGFPKGAQLSHFNLVADAWYVSDCMNLTEKDRVCIPVPFYHCFGCVLGVLGCLTRGAAMVIPAEYFDPRRTLVALEKERCTAIYGVPTMFIAELAEPDFERFSFPSLRTGIMAGSPCPIEVMRKVVDRMGAREITIAYGQTEASPVITQTRTDDPLELRVATVGRPIPEIEVKIVDPETGNEVPRNQQGELCARGFIIMKGYYKNPEATERAIDAEGWLHTGDLATMDGNGYCKITGRLKDMIIRGGENVYPREIEEFLYTHPDVADVQVVGVPDARFGEEVMAWIQRAEGSSITEDQVREFCKGRIAHYKVPRYVRFVNDFPMTVTGKIQKYRLREIAIEELGLRTDASIETA